MNLGFGSTKNLKNYYATRRKYSWYTKKFMNLIIKFYIKFYCRHVTICKYFMNISYENLNYEWICNLQKCTSVFVQFDILA